MEMQFFENYVEEDEQIITYIKGDRDEYLEVVREKLKYKITPKSCFLYLVSHYPKIKFSKQQISKCTQIFNLILKKSNFIEHNDDQTHIGHELFDNFIGVLRTKTYYAKEILFSQKLKIICVDANDNVENSVYSIKQIIFDDEKYEKCVNFWANIIYQQDIRNVLLKIFSCDIIDHIFSVMRNYKILY